jgi:hypothetical protein
MTDDDQGERRRPDMKRLNELDLQVEELVASGQWDYPAFLSIYKQAKEAAAGRGDGYNFLWQAAKPEWRKKHLLSDDDPQAGPDDEAYAPTSFLGIQEPGGTQLAGPPPGLYATPADERADRKAGFPILKAHFARERQAAPPTGDQEGSAHL